MSPSLNVNQSKLLTDMALCVDYYRLFSPGLMVCTHVPVQLDDDTRITVHLAAMVNFGEHKQCSESEHGDCFQGPPNFVLDIHTSDEEYNYRRSIFETAGVIEYVSIQADQQPRALWNQLINGQYTLIDMEGNDTMESQALPGLWIPKAALRAKDWFSIMGAIAQGTSRKGHHDLMTTIWSS